MTRVKDFVTDHMPSKHVIVLGMSPAKRKIKHKAHSNGTLIRLDSWMKHCNQRCWSFHNVIPEVEGSSCMADVDSQALLKAVKNKTVVIALGTFVERVCKKHAINCFKIDHPSARNRNFNDPNYEPLMLARLKDFLEKSK